jgi:hypothetical protein
LGVALGTLHVEDNLRRLVARGGDAAEEKVADAGDDRGAARGDAILGGEDEESREDAIDVVVGLKFGHITDEGGAEVSKFALLKFAGMVGAEAGAEIGDGEAAAAARGKTVLAAG